MKWILITEEKIPNNIELFDASFKSNANSNEYSPTIEFLKYAYSRLNDEFFKNDVSANKPVEFKLEQLIEKSGNKLGYAEINRDDDTNEIESYCIVLNKSAKLTVRGWYETILHEMIHIYEEAYFPDNMNIPDYEPHGDWFINQCNRFKKCGFNIGGTYDGQFGIEDDDEMKDMLSEYIYLQPGMRNGNPDL